MQVVEMEAAAIAQTCYQFGTKFIVCRSVSDKAEEGTRVTFDEFLQIAAVNSSILTTELIKKTLKLIIKSAKESKKLFFAVIFMWSRRESMITILSKLFLILTSEKLPSYTLKSIKSGGYTKEEFRYNL